MGACCGQSTPDNTIWVVTLPSGEKLEVIGEQNALAERIKAGGGTIRKKA